jgi:tetratricopeptide (TPR) repeat protein
MMDGDFNFNSGIIGGIRYAALLGEMPEFIIVGIKNTDRSKDIFPEEVTYRDGSKDGGRADRYLDFIREDLLDEKKYAAALEVLQYRADLYPRSADARVALGDAYRQSGHTAKARECYNQALAIAPGHAAATSKLGELDKK